MLFLLIIYIIFFNFNIMPSFFLKSSINNLFFKNLSFILKCRQGIFFNLFCSISAYNTLTATVRLFLKVFQSYFTGRQFILFQLYLLIKGSIFDILWILFFQILHDLMQLLLCIERIYYHHWRDLLQRCFSVNQENLYMIHCDLHLFYDISNPKNTCNQRYNHYLPLIFLTQFDIDL